VNEPALTPALAFGREGNVGAVGVASSGASAFGSYTSPYCAMLARSLRSSAVAAGTICTCASFR
jgi:hypothetical protein